MRFRKCRYRKSCSLHSGSACPKSIARASALFAVTFLPTVLPLSARVNPTCQYLVQKAGRLLERLRHVGDSALRDKRTAGRVRAAMEEIPRVARTMEEVRANLAQRFTDVGDKISQVSDLCHALVGDTERLLQSASGAGEEGTALQRTVVMVESTLSYVDTCNAKFEAVVDHLHHCERQIAEILRLESEWSGVVAPLKHIRTLCRIEAAVLPPEMGAMFLALTTDIEQLEGKVGAMFAERFALLDSMLATIRKLARHLDIVLPENRAKSLAKRTQISTTLREIEEQLSHNSKRDFSLAVATRSVSETVTQIVVSLQCDDIVAQKSAHVIEALDELRAAAANPTVLTDHSRLGNLHRLARIQSAHVAAIGADLQAAETTVTDGFNRILTDVAQLDKNCLALHDLKKVTIAGDGMVQVLLDALTEAESLVQATVNEAREGYNRLSPLGAMTNSLTAAMSELSVSMHLIALNAQIQAIQHGTGTGLEVLAARMAEISRGISEVSTRALASLDDLAGRVRGTIEEFAQLRAEGDRHAETMSVDWKERESQLHAMRDHTLNAMQSIGSESEQIAKLSQRIINAFRVHQAVEAELERVRLELDRVAAATAPFAYAADHADAAADATHARRYTMASERAIHEAIAAGTEPAAEPPPAAEPADEKAPAPGAPAPSGAPAPAAAAGAGAIELF